MILVKEKLQNLIITNPLFRRFRVFLSHVVRPFLVKTFGVLIAFLIVVVIGLNLFKPDLLTKIFSNLRHHFFVQLNTKYSESLTVNISGNQRVTNEEITKVILDANKDRPEFYIQNLIDDIKTNLPWIHDITITRSLPNHLNVTVSEFAPFAIFQSDGQKYLTDRDGNLILYKDSDEFDHLVILSGNGANKHARALFNIFATDPELSENVFSATWIGNRRWDIRFENGLLIRLPESEISDAWHRLIKINNMPGSLTGLKIIDLRIQDKVYLEYNDSVIKELKNI